MKIRKITKKEEKANTIILGMKESDFYPYLTAEEKQYLSASFHKDNKQIFIDRLSTKIFLQIIDPQKKKKENELLEWLRVEGSKYRNSFDNYEIKSIQLIHAGGSRTQVISFIEGIALSHYRFLKYFKDKEKKAVKLKEISVFSDILNE
ncbi:MAG: hypothetical protein ACOCZL_06985, partial [Bacteroidota bacterium]